MFLFCFCFFFIINSQFCNVSDLLIHELEATDPVPLHQSREEIEYTMPTHPEPKYVS